MNYTIESYHIRTLVTDVWRFLRPYRARFFGATVLRIFSDIVWLYPAFALGSIVTYLSTAEGERASMVYLYTIVGFWFFAIVVRIVGQTGSKYINNHIAEHAKIDMELSLMQRLSDLSLTWHEQEHSGSKMKRVMRGAESLAQLIKIWMNNCIEICINFIGMPFILWQYDPVIAIVTAVFLVVYFGISRSLHASAQRAAQAVSHAEEGTQEVVFEVLNNIRTVKVLSMEEGLLSRLRQQSGELYQKIHQRIFCFQRKNIILQMLSYFFRFFAIGYIIFGILQGQFAVGFLVMFYTYYHRIWESINELAEITETFGIAQYNIKRAMDIFVEPVAAPLGESASFSSQWRDIHVSHVSLYYGDVCALDDVSFTLHRGEKVGLVGSSGAGKSSLFKILLKELESYDGDVLVDETSLRHIDTASYRTKAAVVLQETEVFNFTLKENITLSGTGVIDLDRLKHAIDISHVSGFLHKLPLGLDTPIGEKGVKLSGGEKQRLGIARAVYKQPDIFFLDEATSHLDVESEGHIQDSLGRVFQDVTAVVIAHRLTTIQQMDRIIVLEYGRIVEEGSFTELIKKQGRFFELWQKQNI